MRRTKLLLSLVIVMLLGAAYGLTALGLDVELKGGGGLAMGATDDSNKSGEVRYALDAGLEPGSLFVLNWVRMCLGPLRRRRVRQPALPWRRESFPTPPPLPAIQPPRPPILRITTCLFPCRAGRRSFDMASARSLTLRGGGFAGYFLSGTTGPDLYNRSCRSYG